MEKNGLLKEQGSTQPSIFVPEESHIWAAAENECCNKHSRVGEKLVEQCVWIHCLSSLKNDRDGNVDDPIWT